jgi:hypothetical protein
MGYVQTPSQYEGGGSGPPIPVPIVDGGTGQTTAPLALTALGAAALAGATFTGAVTVSGAPLTAHPVVSNGLTGATAASRYAGATAGGPPASGTFATGDYVIDRLNGGIIVCTAGGTPGSWVAVSGILDRMVYAPAALDAPTIASNTGTPPFSAFETGVCATHAFTVPPSGNVKVSIYGVFATSTLQLFGLGLVNTGGSTLQGLATTINPPADSFPFTFEVPVTGLTPGATAQFDLAGAMTGSAQTLAVQCVTVTNPIVATQKGGPLIMTTYAA